MISLKSLLNPLEELEYPLAKGDELQTHQGDIGWKGKIIWTTPQKFMSMAHSLPDYAMNEKSYFNLHKRMKEGLPIDPLKLVVDMSEKKVIGHEGRHRAKVAQELGIQKVPVLIYTGSGFDRVPKWKPEDHKTVDDLDFKPEWMNEGKIKNPLLVYHGTGVKFRKFNLKYSTQGILWFTSDKEKIKTNSAGAQGKGYIITAEVTIKNPAGWKEYENLLLDELRGRGYDGVILPDPDGKFDCFVFNPDQVKIVKYEKADETS